MVKIDPTSKKDQHCKIYVEPEVKEAIEKFQKECNYASFSEAGRRLILEGLQSYDENFHYT